MSEDATVDAVIAALEAVGELVLSLQGESMGAGWTRVNQIRVVASSLRAPRWGDVVLFERYGRLYAHRLIFRIGLHCWTKGDGRWAVDAPAIQRDEIKGVVLALVFSDGSTRPLRWRKMNALCQFLRALAAAPWLFMRGRAG
ncbi:MAG: hypothetical protein H3C50_03160 [Kiritimatiellae bacterium]|nr:hypothetical protein [Kiritimatiellia bacterium]MCO5044508.1 hypothetical protein [Kiritimatiellia bacterium]MCO5061443.1 hypothetical protein [Kiritimatiellia bacterium]MCO5067484.1 hypothetical protein [Kiritimatiellia bacterium]